MQQHLKQLGTWIKKNQPTQQEKQTLYHEVVRRARTNSISSPMQPTPWYRNFSISTLPLVTVSMLAIVFFTYKLSAPLPINNTLEPSLKETDRSAEYQVLSAYEQVDKISKEKASLRKIIQELPTETVALNVENEILSIEKYLKTDETFSQPEPVIPIDTQTVAATEKTIVPIHTNTTTEKEPVETQPEKTIATRQIDREKVREYYEKVKKYNADKNYTEALILIGETKKIISREITKDTEHVPSTNDSNEIIKKQ